MKNTLGITQILFTFLFSLSNTFGCDFYDFEEAILLDEVTEIQSTATNCPSLTTLTSVSGSSLLHLATEYDSLESMEYLLNEGVGVNYIDDFGATALHFAQSVDAAKLLLKNNIRLSKKDRYGRTAFSMALENQNKELMIYLLKEGSKVRVIDVQWAGRNYDLESLEFLADNATKSQLKGSGKYFNTFFFYNDRYLAVAKKLVSLGADLNQAKTISSRRSLLDFYMNEYIKDQTGYLKNGLKALVWLSKHGADVNGYMPRSGSSVFHAIFWKEDLEKNKVITEQFLANGLNINHSYKSDSHKNALMKLAFQRGSDHYLEGMAKFLLEKGANPKQQSIEGRTPLHWAVRWANHSVAKVLVSVSDLNQKDNNGNNALAYAKKRLKETPMTWEKRNLIKIIKMIKSN